MNGKTLKLDIKTLYAKLFMLTGSILKYGVCDFGNTKSEPGGGGRF
jgi:hypothetical protein